MIKVAVEFWKLRIHIREEELMDESDKELYFASEGLAELAAEWSYRNYLDSLLIRSDVVDLKETSTTKYKKIDWWKKTDSGYIAMKDYFYWEKETFERRVID